MVRTSRRRRFSARRTSRRRRRSRRVSRNGAATQIGRALAAIRRRGDRWTAGRTLSKSGRWALVRAPAGLYRLSGGRSPAVSKFGPGTALSGALTSTRIAAASSREPHWLVKVYPSGDPRIVVVRKVDSKGRTVFRIEDAA